MSRESKLKKGKKKGFEFLCFGKTNSILYKGNQTLQVTDFQTIEDIVILFLRAHHWKPVPPCSSSLYLSIKD